MLTVIGRLSKMVLCYVPKKIFAKFEQHDVGNVKYEIKNILLQIFPADSATSNIICKHNQFVFQSPVCLTN